MIVKCPIFGDPCDFSENQLPSYNAVMKCYQLVRNEMKVIWERFFCVSHYVRSC